MKNLLLALLVLTTFFVLSSCGSKDKEYYKAHPEEMKQKMEECTRMSAAEKMADRECSAVSQADSDRFFGDKIQRPLQGSGKGQGFKKF